MTRELSDFEKKKEKKFLRMRGISIAAFVIGLILFDYIQIHMGNQGAKNLAQVYGLLLGGVLVFAGGSGIAIGTLFLRLLRKNKNKSW